MGLSVVSIVRDEIQFIDGMLSSVHPNLGKDDELIVIDGGSTDGTWEYLKGYSSSSDQIRVEQWPQKFEYYHFKDHDQITNKLIDMAKNDWYLSIDADEAFDPELWNAIPELINQDKYDAYYFPTYNFYGSGKKYLKDGFFYPDLHIRLANREKTWWVGDDHKSIWKKKRVYDVADYHACPFSPEDSSAKVLPYHLFHYARFKKGYKERLGKEPDNVVLAEYTGKHPREDFNECNLDKPKG